MSREFSSKFTNLAELILISFHRSSDCDSFDGAIVFYENEEQRSQALLNKQGKKWLHYHVTLEPLD